MPTLRDYVNAWQATCSDLLTLVGQLEPHEWQLPTDLPSWSVHDVFAHVTALEAELAGSPRPKVHVDTSLPHIASKADVYTERGVLAGRERSPAELIEQFLAATRARSEQLETEPLDDPRATPPRTPGDIAWDWETLLRNRVIDLWVHEQDIRRAVDRTGDLDTVGARITSGTFAMALPYLVGKRAEAPPGSSLVIRITGAMAGEYVVVVADDGRAHIGTELPTSPTTTLTMSAETFTMLGAGRRDPTTLPVEVDGDADLAGRLLTRMTLTM